MPEYHQMLPRALECRRVPCVPLSTVAARFRAALLHGSAVAAACAAQPLPHRYRWREVQGGAAAAHRHPRSVGPLWQGGALVRAAASVQLTPGSACSGICSRARFLCCRECTAASGSHGVVGIPRHGGVFGTAGAGSRAIARQAKRGAFSSSSCHCGWPSSTSGWSTSGTDGGTHSGNAQYQEGYAATEHAVFRIPRCVGCIACLQRSVIPLNTIGRAGCTARSGFCT